MDALRAGKQVALSLDLKPALDEQKLDARLLRDFEHRCHEPLKSVLRGLLPRELVVVCLQETGLGLDQQVGTIRAHQRRQLRTWLKDFRLEVTGYRGFEEAIVTAGGIDLSEIDPRPWNRSWSKVYILPVRLSICRGIPVAITCRRPFPPAGWPVVLRASSQENLKCFSRNTSRSRNWAGKNWILSWLPVMPILILPLSEWPLSASFWCCRLSGRSHRPARYLPRVDIYQPWGTALVLGYQRRLHRFPGGQPDCFGPQSKRDDYTPGGLNNRRPDRAVLVYANLIRTHFKNTCPTRPWWY